MAIRSGSLFHSAIAVGTNVLLKALVEPCVIKHCDDCEGGIIKISCKFMYLLVYLYIIPQGSLRHFMRGSKHNTSTIKQTLLMIARDA